MPRRFVRDSKFRHVFGKPYKKADCYDNIDISKNTWDGGQYCAVNSKFLAIVLEGHGGGTFTVLPIDQTGRRDTTIPKINGHKGKVLDIKFNPFNTNIVASAAEDGRIKLWRIPEGGLKSSTSEPVIELSGHSCKKVGIIQWNPVANNIIASAGFDNTIIIWDVGTGQKLQTISGHTDTITSLTWNQNGSLLATTCKDKKVRVIDPRKEEILQDFKAHEGSKPSRVFFTDTDRLITVGCGVAAVREICLWDLTSSLESPITKHELDQGSGNMLAMYDETLKILYIGVKGDCNIRYYEISNEEPYIHFLSEYNSTMPQRGFGVLPKRALDYRKCEIYRLYKLTSKSMCEPVSMVVPRKSDSFQEDIYPPVPGDKPSLTADQWGDGENAEPILISLENDFVAEEKDFKVNTRSKNVKNQSAPKEEQDFKKSFHQQQEELKKLKEILDQRNIRITELEEEIKKMTVYDDIDNKEENEEIESPEEEEQQEECNDSEPEIIADDISVTVAVA